MLQFHRQQLDLGNIYSFIVNKNVQSQKISRFPVGIRDFFASARFPLSQAGVEHNFALVKVLKSVFKINGYDKIQIMSYWQYERRARASYEVLENERSRE